MLAAGGSPSYKGVNEYVGPLYLSGLISIGLPIVSCSVIDSLILGPSFRISDSTWCHRTTLSHLATQLGYSAGGFQALQLIVLAAFGVVD